MLRLGVERLGRIRYILLGRGMYSTSDPHHAGPIGSAGTVVNQACIGTILLIRQVSNSYALDYYRRFGRGSNFALLKLAAECGALSLLVHHVLLDPQNVAKIKA